MSEFDEAVIQRIRSLEREVERLQRWERPIVITDHGALAGLGDDDHPQYLLTTGKAADSDKLDGIDSTGFATASHNHDAAYLGISAKAADSDKLDGVDSTEYQRLLDKQRGIELAYNYGSDASSYLDFHTINDQKDYDARILASGGSSSVGKANLTLSAANIIMSGVLQDSSGVEYVKVSDLGAWTAYTPTWTAVTTNPSIGNGTLVGRYTQIGKTCILVIGLTMGSTTTYGSGNWSFSLPKTAKYTTGINFYGVAHLRKVGTANYERIAQIAPTLSTTVINMFIDPTPGSNSLYINSTTPFTWGNGDTLDLEITYEIA